MQFNFAFWDCGCKSVGTISGCIQSVETACILNRFFDLLFMLFTIVGCWVFLMMLVEFIEEVRRK